MRRLISFLCAAILTLAAAAFVFVACDQKDGTEALPLLSADGEDIVNSAGETVALRGTNFGGWLVQESWMCPTEQTDTLETNMTLYSRFGEERAEELIAAYEDSWITEEDFANVKALGLNVVRIPFTYMNLYRYLSAEDNGDGTYDVELLHPDDFTLREDAFGRLDWALEMCEKYGLYAILDLHGAVGSQNGNDHSGDTQLTDLYEDSALGEAYRAKTAELWGLVAEHFAGNTNVAGYDLLNEPGGASGSTQWDYYDVLYDAVRAADPDHMIFIEAVWEGFDLPSPSQYDWTNVVYEYHHYNWEGNNQSNKSFYGLKQRLGARTGVPALVGEFNVWGDDGRTTGDSSQTDNEAYAGVLEFYNGEGWHWTTWTYKVTGDGRPSGWGLYNTVENAVKADPATDSYEDILAVWSSYGTGEKFALYEEFAAVVTEAAAAPFAEGEPEGGYLIFA